MSKRSAAIAASVEGPTDNSPGRTSPPGISSRTEDESASAIAACKDTGNTVNRRPA